MRHLLLIVRRHPLFAALAITCSGPRVLWAQNASDRPSLDQLQEALASATTTSQLDEVAGAWDSNAPRPVERLGDAFIQLRRAVMVNDRRAFVAAWDGFDQAVRLHPDWPYARMGLAMTALEVHVRHYPLPAMYDGVASGTHYDGYLLQVGHLFKAEPGFKPGIDWVVGTMIADGDYAQPVVVLDALAYVADSTDLADPRIELVLARSSRVLGDPVQSLSRIQDYLTDGGDLGVARLEQARTLAWMGVMDSAAAAYLAGARVTSPAARAAYESDIDWVASPQELASLEQLPGDSIGVFIGSFWRQRDAQSYQPAGSPLQEHLSRWVYVAQHFAPPDRAYRAMFLPPGVTSCSAVAQHPDSQPLVDRRAVLYMRYGASMQPGGASVALRDAVGDGNPALAYRYDPGLMGGGNIMSSGEDPARALKPYAGGAGYVPFQPTSFAPIPSDSRITWVYVVEGELYEAVRKSCPR